MKKTNMKKIYLIIGLLLIVSFITETIYLTHSDALASESVKAEELRNKIATIDEKNQILNSEILSHASILVVSSRAAELGFEKPREFISLDKNESLALKHE